ncbi:hypothetical protein [Kibdelosporangium philippinense]|uniref:hypothetical protein n=1 Tax=Kibdelosporangium philippinense TaxID=211113 RepID=UPI003610A229
MHAGDLVGQGGTRSSVDDDATVKSRSGSDLTNHETTKPIAMNTAAHRKML